MALRNRGGCCGLLCHGPARATVGDFAGQRDGRLATFGHHAGDCAAAGIPRSSRGIPGRAGRQRMGLFRRQLDIRRDCLRSLRHGERRGRCFVCRRCCVFDPADDRHAESVQAERRCGQVHPVRSPAGPGRQRHVRRDGPLYGRFPGLECARLRMADLVDGRRRGRADAYAGSRCVGHIIVEECVFFPPLGEARFSLALAGGIYGLLERLVGLATGAPFVVCDHVVAALGRVPPRSAAYLSGDRSGDWHCRRDERHGPRPVLGFGTSSSTPRTAVFPCDSHRQHSDGDRGGFRAPGDTRITAGEDEGHPNPAGQHALRGPADTAGDSGDRGVEQGGGRHRGRAGAMLLRYMVAARRAVPLVSGPKALGHRRRSAPGNRRRECRLGHPLDSRV